MGTKVRCPSRTSRSLRDELFSVDQLDRHAKILASQHEVTAQGAAWLRSAAAPSCGKRGFSPRGLPPGGRCRETRPAHHAGGGVVSRQLPADRRADSHRAGHLPRGYSRELPLLSKGPSAGYPRVYAIALELISHVDGRVDAESLRAFTASYQSVAPLQLGELWAIPIMLRLALLENLRRVVGGLPAGRRDRERAAHWIDRMLDIAAKAPADSGAGSGGDGEGKPAADHRFRRRIRQPHAGPGDGA